MKTFTHLVVLATICLSAISAQAQSISPGNPQTLNYYGGYGHRIYVQSFTFKANVNLGGQFALLRTVQIDEFGNWNNYLDLDALTAPIYTSGIDEFTVPLPSQNSWHLRVHYRYLADPDGNGPINIGDDAVPLTVIGPIQPKTDPNTHITAMDIYGSSGQYVDIEVMTGVYTEVEQGGENFDTHLILEVRNMSLGTPGVGVVVWYDSSWVNPIAMNGQHIEPYFIYLLTGGEICATARLRYSHDGPGNSADFVGRLVSQSATICDVSCGDISTGVEEDEGLAPCELRMFPNPATDQVTIEGFKQNLPIVIHASNGQLIRPASPMPTGEQMVVDVSDLAAGMYSLQQEGAKGCQFIVVKQ